MVINHLQVLGWSSKYQATVKEKLLTAEPSSKTPRVVEPPEEAVQVEVRRVEKSMENTKR